MDHASLTSEAVGHRGGRPEAESMCTERPAPNTGATAPCCEKPEGALGAGRGRGTEASSPCIWGAVTRGVGIQHADASDVDTSRALPDF